MNFSSTSSKFVQLVAKCQQKRLLLPATDLKIILFCSFEASCYCFLALILLDTGFLIFRFLPIFQVF